MQKQWLHLLSHADPYTFHRYLQTVLSSLLSTCSVTVQNECLAVWDNVYCRWNQIPVFILECTMRYLNLQDLTTLNALCHYWYSELNKHPYLWSHLGNVRIDATTRCTFTHSIVSMLPRLALHTSEPGNLHTRLFPRMPNVKSLAVCRCLLSTHEAGTLGARFPNVTCLVLTRSSNRFNNRFSTLAFLQLPIVSELISTDVIATNGPINQTDCAALHVSKRLRRLTLISTTGVLHIEHVTLLLQSSHHALQHLYLKHLSIVGLDKQGNSWNTALLLISQLPELRTLKLQNILIPACIQTMFLHNLSNRQQRQQLDTLHLAGHAHFFDFIQDIMVAPFLHVKDLVVDLPSSNPHFECLVRLFPNISHLQLTDPYRRYHRYTCVDLLVLRKLLLLDHLHVCHHPVNAPPPMPASFTPVIWTCRSALEYDWKNCAAIL